MLDMTNLKSWKQRIQLYYEIASGTDASYLGPEQDKVVSDLSQPEKDRLRADIRATNILLQGLPRDIYKLINHNTDAKDIWDNVKMLLEGSELTKDDRESQLGNVAAGNGRAQNKVGNANVGQGKPIKCYKCNIMFMANLSSAAQVYDEAGPSYDLYTLSKAKALKEKAKSAKPIIAMTVYPPNAPAKITLTGLTEGERGFEQTNTCYLTKVIPFFKTLKEHFEGTQTTLIKEIKEMKEVFDQIEAELDQHVIDKKCDEIERKNLLLENENLIAECLSKDVFYTATNSMLKVSRFFDMHDAYTAAQKRIAKLEAENSSMKNKIQNDDHDEMIKHFF
uniref:Integrase, catalytic region, zinc finger, CCHC-type, peptidase aspartic, catalytic n=1 Tax=Tanacetum cinerariifolium TaxID=118510 RepID=A0A6L2MQG9_TANCI|nr:hypothetical protein [Tanacetum cinerariifolium]